MLMQTLSPFSQVKVWLLHESTMRRFFLLFFLEGFLGNSEGSLTTEPESEVLYLPQWTKGITRDDLTLSTDSPLKLKLEINPEEIQEALPAIVSCSVSYHVPDEPIKMILSGLEQQHISAQNSADENRKVCKELSFVPTWEYHGKLLTCSLINKNEEVISQSTMKLDVKHAPKGVELRADPGTTLQEGEKLSLECLVKSSNPVVFEYQWWKDDDRTYEGINGSRMEINPVEWQHSGRYGCGARNTLGTSESEELTIHVQYAPKGMELRADPGTTLREGEKLSLECLVNSSYPVVLEYQWWRNNHLTNGTINGSRMEINPVEQQHSGRYKCTARNAVGTTESKELIIDVQYPPKETKIPFRSRTIKENDAVTLECSFTASPPITKYEWYKNPASNVIGSQTELHFLAIQPNDSGTYYCKAYNAIDEATSSLVTLDVLYRPKDVQLAVLNSLPIKEGQTIKFNCSVGSSNPPTNWYMLLENNVARTRPTESSLITSSAKPGTVIVYHCEACNNVGCTSSSRISVNVHFAPKNVKAVRDPPGPIKEGAFLNLSCQVEAANPEEITYRWSKDQQHLVAKGATLIIQEVTPGDSGSYSCDATNSVGTTASRPLRLNVQYAPKGVELRAEPGTALREGDKLSLECLVNSSYPVVLEYQWWRNNHLTNGTINMSRMEIDPVGQQHSGRYKCSAGNTLGTTESKELIIDVQYPPEEPKIAFSSRTGKEDVTLHCWSTANPPITHYEWYKCPTLDIISSEIELHFPAIQPNNSGGYYCKAYNPIGHSTSSVLTLNIHSDVCN